EGKYGSDDFYRVAAESARRAVLDPRCNPLREMPPMDKYEQWRELTLIFDPQDLIY
ncbi:MAG: energy transducer TonB, partial [Alphaproteobacteria bacterium CG11_big_fil_rev_8_21_14_0_20_44_7]